MPPKSQLITYLSVMGGYKVLDWNVFYSNCVAFAH